MPEAGAFMHSGLSSPRDAFGMSFAHAYGPGRARRSLGGRARPGIGCRRSTPAIPYLSFRIARRATVMVSNAVTSRARTRSVSQRTANVLTFPRLLMTDPTPDAMPRAPYRRFRDAGDGDWLVWRLSEDVVGEIREAPSLGRAWLIFLGPDGKTRRLAPVPPEWQRMSEEQLHELALRATHF